MGDEHMFDTKAGEWVTRCHDGRHEPLDFGGNGLFLSLFASPVGIPVEVCGECGAVYVDEPKVVRARMPEMPE